MKKGKARTNLSLRQR